MGLKELGLVLGVLLAWFVLSRWVLPWLGVPTCMSGACAVDSRPTATEEVSDGSKPEGEVR